MQGQDSSQQDQSGLVLVPETKPFYKTSEFWIIVAVNIGAIFSAVADILPGQYVPLINALSAMAYAISRGLAKSGTSPIAPAHGREPTNHMPPPSPQA